MEKRKKKEEIYLHVYYIKMEQNIVFNVREQKKKNTQTNNKEEEKCLHVM